MATQTDFYELLEVERTADDKTIKTSYRRLAMQCHPDKNPGCNESEARFKAISEAYDCLKDPQKRASLSLQPGFLSGWHCIARRR